MLLLFSLLLASRLLPVLDLTLAKNPDLRFCTFREGLYVFRFAPRVADAEKGRDWRVCTGIDEDVMDVLGVLEVMVEDSWGRIGRREKHVERVE